MDWTGCGGKFSAPTCVPWRWPVFEEDMCAAYLGGNHLDVYSK